MFLQPSVQGRSAQSQGRSHLRQVIAVLLQSLQDALAFQFVQRKSVQALRSSCS